MKIKILLVEDELELRENIKDILEIHDFELAEADHGQMGVEMLEEYNPDIVVSDVMMPVMDGYEFLETVRKNGKHINLPFLFLTAKVDKDDVRRGMETGAEDYLTKPIQAKDLVNAINASLNKKWNRDMWLQHKVEEVLAEERKVKYHELRTPLFGLNSLLHIIKDSLGVLSEEHLIELLNKAISSGDRLNSSLLNLARYQGVDVIRTERIWLPSVKNYLLKLLESADQKQHYRISGSDFGCWFDYKQFEFIVGELITNAFKFNSGEYIVVELKDRKIKVFNQQVIFDVPQIIEIQPFSQINRKYFEQQGLGLGLYLSLEYAKKNQACLSITVDQQKVFCAELTLLKE
ncbi:Response regulator receiver domain-containing protein [Belliella buryatensis]|uniref:histidine kinase n=1 Tax=Belliella buryatensis TaxID=1500549 RepID=A0A239DUI2_9BACT|nr:response regulator [Belliella buryatensis]SNS36285.1 Response regulator receiver domain-containing protein [Belliella buryatensis]